MSNYSVDVVSILSGGAFIGIKKGTQERKTYMLAYIDVPKYDMYDETKCQPFGFEAKELLRQHILGKEVKVKAIKEFEKGSVLCVATFKEKNIAARIAADGFARIREARGKDAESPDYGDTFEACEKASREKLGLYGPANSIVATVPVVPNSQIMKNDILKFGNTLMKASIDNVLDPVTFDVSILPSSFASKGKKYENKVFRFRIKLFGIRLVNWQQRGKTVAPTKQEENLLKELNTLFTGKTVYLRLYGVQNQITIGSSTIPVVASGIYFTDKITRTRVVKGETVKDQVFVNQQVENEELNSIASSMEERKIFDEKALFLAQNTDIRNKIIALVKRDYTYWLLWTQFINEKCEDGFTFRSLDVKGDSFADRPSMKYRSEVDIKLIQLLDDITFNPVYGLGDNKKQAQSTKKQDVKDDDALVGFLSTSPKFRALVTRVSGSFSPIGGGAAKGSVSLASSVNAFYCIPLDGRYKRTNCDVPKIIAALLAGDNEGASRLIKSLLQSMRKSVSGGASEVDMMAAFGEIRVQFARIHMNYDEPDSMVSAYETREFIRTILMSGKLQGDSIVPGIVTVQVDRVMGSATNTEGDNITKRTPSVSAFVTVSKAQDEENKSTEYCVNEELIKAGYAKFAPMMRKMKLEGTEEKGEGQSAQASVPVDVDELNADTFPNLSFYLRLNKIAEGSGRFFVGGEDEKRTKGARKSRSLKVPEPEFIKTLDVTDVKKAEIAKHIMNRPTPCTVESVRVNVNSEDLRVKFSSLSLTVATHTPFAIKGKKVDLSNVTIPNIVSSFRIGGINIMDIIEPKTNQDKCLNACARQLITHIVNNLTNGCQYDRPFYLTTKTEAPAEFNLMKLTTKHSSYIGELAFSSQYLVKGGKGGKEGATLARANIDIAKMLVGAGLAYVDTRSPDLSSREAQIYSGQIAKILNEAESKRLGAWDMLKSCFKIDNVSQLIASINEGRLDNEISDPSIAGSVKYATDFAGGISVGSIEHPTIVKLTIDTTEKSLLVSPSIIMGLISDERISSKHPVKVHMVGVSDDAVIDSVKSCIQELSKFGGKCTLDLLCFGTARLTSTYTDSVHECVCGVIYLQGESPKFDRSGIFDLDKDNWVVGSFNSFLISELNGDYATSGFYGKRYPALAKISLSMSRYVADLEYE